jgi:hypothetical protein
LNITKTVRKFPIDPHLRSTGAEFHSGLALHNINHGEETKEEFPDGAIPLTSASFEALSHHFPILVVNFNAPWCYWSNRLVITYAYNLSNFLKFYFSSGIQALMIQLGMYS